MEFKNSEDVIEEVEKFCYFGDMSISYGGASAAVSPKIGSAWKNLRKLSGALDGKQVFSLKQRGKIYHVSGRLFCIGGNFCNSD